MLRKIYCLNENLMFDVCHAIEITIQLNGQWWSVAFDFDYMYPSSQHDQHECSVADLYAIRSDINNLIFTQMQMLSKFASLRFCISNIIIIKTLLFVRFSCASISSHSYSTPRRLTPSPNQRSNRSLWRIHNFQWIQSWLKWILSLHLIKLRTKPFRTTANYLLAQ